MLSEYNTSTVNVYTTDNIPRLGMVISIEPVHDNGGDVSIKVVVHEDSVTSVGGLITWTALVLPEVRKTVLTRLKQLDEETYQRVINDEVLEAREE